MLNSETTNNMIQFAKQNRTTNFFRELGIIETRIAYRIMEYLAPDETYPPKINQFTKDLILQKQFDKAYEYICEEISLEGHNIDTGSSCYNEGLQKHSVELIEYLLPIYLASIKNHREKLRAELLEKLNELNKEESADVK
jgi:hypothetical protein